MSAIRPYEPASTHWDTAREREVDMQLDAEERERDSREKLEADVDKFCLRLSDSGTVVGAEPLTRIRNAATRWLDRQAAITEREWKEQCAADECCGFQELVDINTQAQAKVDELTEERDRLRGQLDDFDGDCYCGATVTEWYELATRLQAEVDGLKAEIGLHVDEHNRLRRQVALKDDIIEGLRQSLDEIMAERNALAAQVEAKEQLERDSAYMRLPVDADGVPIRPGDMLEYDGSKPLKVDSIRLDKRGRWHLHFDGRLGDWWAGASSHHVQPDTVESLLEEFHGKLWSDDEEQMALLDEYAERIRRACNG